MIVLIRLMLAALLFVVASAPISSASAQRQPVPALNGIPVFQPDTGFFKRPADFNWGQVIGIFADDQGHVWTSSSSRISEWDANGALLQSWSARGPNGNWSTIHGMFVDHNGFVWTNARESNLTVKFSKKGDVVLTIGIFDSTGGSNHTSLMGRPSEIWVDPADNEVFIADGYGNRRIVVFDGATGRYLRHWGAYGRRPADPAPRGGGGGGGAAAAGRGGDSTGRGGAAAAGARGAGAAAGAAGAAGAAAAGAGARGGAGGAAAGAAAGGGGRGGGGRAGGAAAGAPPAPCPPPNPGRGGGGNAAAPPAEPPQQFSIPHGIVGSRDGLIYLADRANNRVQAFRQNGQFVMERILRPRCGQEAAAWNPKRPCGTEAAFSLGFSHDVPQTYLYVADGGTHVITVLRRSDLEVVDEFGGPGVGPGQLGRPHNLTVDPAGNIFVAEAAGPMVNHPVTGFCVGAGYRAQKFTFTGTKPAR